MSPDHKAYYILGFPGLEVRSSESPRSIAMPIVLAVFLNLLPPACFAQANEQPATPFAVQLLPMAGIAVAAYFILFRPERDRQRRQQALLSNLKKNDRVVTSGGLCGTVASVDREAGRVSLKVDESANVKLTVTLASIAQITAAGGDTTEPTP